jgi:type III secretory pathway component EscU
MGLLENIIKEITTIIIMSFIIMLCWNYLMPNLFNLPNINYGQACIMCVLSNALFGDSVDISK